MAASWVAAAAIIFAASAACGFDLNASEDGENGTSSPGNEVPFSAHALLRELTAAEMMVDKSSNVEDIRAMFLDTSSQQEGRMTRSQIQLGRE